MLRPAPVGAPPRSWWRAGAGADAPCGGRPRASSMGLPLKERGCECELFGGSSRPRLEDPPGRGPCEFDPPGRGPCEVDPPGRGPCEFICAGGGRSLWYGWGAICCGCGGPGAIICCCGAMGRCPPGGAMKCCGGGWRCIICGGGICGGIRCIICGGGCCGPGARCGGGPMCCGMWGGICCGGAGRWGHMARRERRGCCRAAPAPMRGGGYRGGAGGHTPSAPAPPHHTLARHDPYTQTPRDKCRTVRPGRRRASEVMGTAGWPPQKLSRRARRTRSGPAGRPEGMA